MVVSSIASLSRRSLKFKFSVAVVGIFLVVYASVSFLSIRHNINLQKKILLSSAKTFSSLATKPIGDSYLLYYSAGFLKFREQLLDALSLSEDIERIQIISVDGDILFDSVYLDVSGAESLNPSKITKPELLKAISANKPTEVKNKNGEINEIIAPYFDEFGARPFSLRYFISYEEVYRNANLTILGILGIGVVFLVIAAAGTVLLVHRSILNPLANIVATARRIREGNLQQTIEVNTQDELADLAASLNQMTVSLKKNIEDLKSLDRLKDEFVFLASHNLRTPLTVIKAYTSQLRKETTLAANLREEVERIETAAGQLEEITESILSLVTLEDRKKPMVKEKVNLEVLLESLTEESGKIAAKKQISFILEFPAKQTTAVWIDKQRVTQGFKSLIDNAIKFNRSGGKIIIKLESEKGSVTVSIKDTGIGIAKKEVPKVFQKFHRATDVLTYDYEGMGLGLYLTKLIIESNGGKIWFESTLGEGSTFFVRFPTGENSKG